MPSVAANDCVLVLDLIKSTRDKFERRILSVGRSIYIYIYLRSVTRAFLLVESRRRVREIRNEIREIAPLGGGARPTINPTSILSMPSFYERRRNRPAQTTLKGDFRPSRARVSGVITARTARVRREMDVLITFGFEIQCGLSI